MKKRILLSYVVALQILLANISFAGYAIPVQEFFPTEEVADIQQDTPQLTVTPVQENIQVKKITQIPVEIVHEDEITLFEMEEPSTVTSDSPNSADKDVSDFEKALEQALEM